MARFGDGHVAAMARLGLKELRNAVNPSRESAADAEIGLYGTATQGEIAEARGGAGQGSEQESLGGTMGLDDLRAYAQERSQEAEAAAWIGKRTRTKGRIRARKTIATAPNVDRNRNPSPGKDQDYVEPAGSGQPRFIVPLAVVPVRPVRRFRASRCSEHAGNAAGA